MCKLLVLIGVLSVAIATVGAAPEPADFATHGFQILGKIVRQYLNSQPDDVKISDGVHLISIRSENDARSATEDNSVFGTIETYLQNHELRIRLPELMPGENFGRAFKDALNGIEGKGDSDPGSPRGSKGGGLGGGKGGMGGILVLGAMMGKMMAAIGIGGVGLLAMKALMTAALALMLSLVIGLKKLVHSGHDDGGGHTVIHAGHGHGHGEYRKKRDAADIAYSAYSAYSSS